MKFVEPEVRIIARPQIDWRELTRYVKNDVGDTSDWVEAHEYSDRDGEDLVEAAGRACYRSWSPGLNPNVTRVRTDQGAYLENILKSAHGSVLEHANYTFSFHHISRVVTHELVRHRAGTAVSQESMRYVRLDDIPMWLPDWVYDEIQDHDDPELLDRIKLFLDDAERFQSWLAERFKLDHAATNFHEKKEKTSFMRRFAPGGVATDMIWTANIRALRHIIESRTAEGAEEEIRLVFGKVAELMKAECPMLFGDFSRTAAGNWEPKYRKV